MVTMIQNPNPDGYFYPVFSKGTLHENGKTALGNWSGWEQGSLTEREGSVLLTSSFAWLVF
jgi:hypothetical protein